MPKVILKYFGVNILIVYFFEHNAKIMRKN
jgi:hypothetical protein